MCKTIKIIHAILLISLLTGCGLITEWEDVSNEAEFAPLIGVEHVSKVDLIIHGVTMDQNYKEILSIYVLSPMPGFDGPEVLSRSLLDKRTTFIIEKVIRCIDCLIKHEEIVLRVQSSRKYDSAPITLGYDYYVEHKDEIFE